MNRRLREGESKSGPRSSSETELKSFEATRKVARIKLFLSRRNVGRVMRLIKNLLLRSSMEKNREGQRLNRKR